MSSIAFHVRGVPAPQGSARAFASGGRAWVTHDNKKTMPWREDIANAAAQEMDRNHGEDHIFRGAINVDALFTLARPRSLPKKWTTPVNKPDLDKLARALLDALTGVVYIDDAQVTTLTVSKRYGDAPGVNVTVFELAGGKPR